jgi:gas vesicle protein
MGLMIGLLLGGLTGLGVMMLLAPQSGKMTRDQIGQKSIELQGRATDTYDDLLLLSNFDNRRILLRTRQNTQNG